MELLKKFSIFFILIIVIIPALSAFPSDRPKVGLVLSGGGARGFAHIGILKILDSLEIPVDYIAGTSMGGIIGALYAIGYSGKEIEDLVEKTDWRETFTDDPERNLLPYFQKKETGKYQVELGLQGLRPKPPSGLIYGQKISLLFSGLTFPYESITDFTQLPIPFHCVAVNLETGNHVVLKQGSLARAMRATMAIPSAFSPVEWGDSLLVDGGMVNNLPVDVVKNMGADIVIAVDVGIPLKEREKLNSALAVLEQSIAMMGIQRWRENVKMADVYIQPDLTDFALTDFVDEKVQGILQSGNDAAQRFTTAFLSLKEVFQLQRFMDPRHCPKFPDETHIREIQVSGYTSTTLESIQASLQLHAGDVFDAADLVDRVSELKSTMGFESVKCEIIPMSHEAVRLVIHIQEKEKPVIFGISITGNTSLPFGYIYQLLGLKPKDALHTDELSQRIMEMYGLGYFENIHYEIEPRGDNRVYLHVRVKELEKRKLRLGVHYDNKYKLVAKLGVQGTNLLIPGLRHEHELQFAGLFQYKFKTYYPSRTLDLPIYPYLRFHAKNIPIDIYDLYVGNKIAQYKNKSISYAAGFGILLGKSLNIELEYQTEHLDVTPNVAFGDPATFPSWDEDLRKFAASLTLDVMDDLSLPNKGAQIIAKYEGSYRELNSELSYELFQISADFYYTLYHRHTFRLYGFTGSGHSLPIFKTPNQGHPSTFVGMDYDQLFGSRISVIRMDYRYRIHSNVYMKLIYNMAFNIRQKTEFYDITPGAIHGYGVSLKVMSPLGPIELIYSRGNKHFGDPKEKQNVFYFLLGANIDKYLFH